jgi:hypothetical protein
MQPLTLEDLLPLEEFTARRAEFFEAHARYCDQYRRIRVGPDAVLLFENRQTLWFRVQEILRVTRLRESEWIQQELDLVNRLLPRANHLQAGLILAGPNEPKGWATPSADSIRLALDTIHISPKLVSCRPEDRAAGLAHWLEFAMSRADRKLLADLDVPAWFEIECGAYDHASGRLTEEMRQSLLDDLEMSDRAAA